VDEAKVKELLAKLDDPNVSPIVKQTIKDGLERAMSSGFKAAYDSQLRYRARTDLECFSEYVFGFKVPPHQKEIIKVLEDPTKREQLIIAPPGSSKCLSENMPICRQNGSITQLKNIEVGDYTLSLDPKTLKLVHGKVLWKEGTGKKKCFRVKTKSGYYVDVTADHRMYTFNGWKECRDITTDDFMAAPRIVPIPLNTTAMPESEVKLLSYWIAEGCRTKHRGTVKFSNIHPDILQEWEESSAYFGWGSTPIKCSGRIIGASLTKGSSPNHPRTLLLKHGLDPTTCGAHEKFVPDAIFKLPQDQLALFLNRLFACDGSFESKNKKRKCKTNCATLSYCTVSRQLADQVRHLLLRFGIMSSITQSMGAYKLPDGTKKETSIAYKVCITEGQMVHRFMSEIGIFTKDVRFTSELKEATRATPLNSVSDRIPKEWRQGLTKSTHYYREHHNIRVDKPGGTFRGKVSAVAEIEDNDELLKLASSDIRWDQVISIDDIGYEQTYDIEVENYHNFFANGLLSHNSSTVAQVFMPYYIGQHPEDNTILLSSSATQSIKFTSDIRSLIVSNDRFKEVFPEIKVDDLKGESREQIYLKRQYQNPHPNIYAAGMKSTKVLGSRANLIVVDDPLTQVQARSEVELRNQKEWFAGTLMTRPDPETGRVIVILTRWHNNDLASLLMNRLNFEVLHMPALGTTDEGAYVDFMPPLVNKEMEGYEEVLEAIGNDEPMTSLPSEFKEDYLERVEEMYEEKKAEGGRLDIAYSEANRRPAVRKFTNTDKSPSIWPKKFSVPFYKQQKARFGTVQFRLLYQGDPTGLEGDIFKREWFKYYGSGVDPRGIETEVKKVPEGSLYFISVDPAISQTAAADFFVAAVIARDPDGNYYIVEVLRTKLEAFKQREAIQKLYRKYPQTSWALIETVAYQQALFQDLLKEGIPCRAYRPKAGKDKEMRARSASALFEGGKVYLPSSAPWLPVFEDEFTSFPKGDKDDQVDAVSMLLEEVSLMTSVKPVTYQVGFGTKRSR